MKKLLQLTLVAMSLMLLPSITFGSIKNPIEKETIQKKHFIKKGTIYLGYMTYTSPNDETLRIDCWGDTDMPGNISASMHVSIDGNPGYAVIYDGLIFLSANSVTFSSVTIYYFGSTSGSFTVPDGTYLTDY